MSQDASATAEGPDLALPTATITPAPDPEVVVAPEPRHDGANVSEAMVHELESRLGRDRHNFELRERLVQAYTWLCLRQLREGSHETAGVWARRALDFAPDHPDALLALAAVELARRDYPAAERALQRLPQAERARGEYHLLRGDLLDGRSRHEEALREYRIARELGVDVGDRLLRLERERSAGLDRTLASRRFEVSFQGAANIPAGRRALDALERAYDQLRRVFRADDFVVSTLLYGDADYRAATGAPDWAAALYDGKIRIPIGGLAVVDEEFRALVTHELAHAFIFHQGGPRVPRWLHEGLAQHLEGRRLPDFELGPGEAARLARAVEPSEPRLYYAQALFRVEALIADYSLPKVVALLADMKSGRSFEEALERNVRTSYRRWLEQLERRGER